MTTENLSLLETKHLVEKSRGKLTMMVLRDDRKFLVSIPEVVDSAPNSEDDRRRYSSSELEGKHWSGKRQERRECGGLRLEYKQYKVSLVEIFFCIPCQTYQTLTRTFPHTERRVTPPGRNGLAGTHHPPPMKQKTQVDEFGLNTFF